MDACVCLYFVEKYLAIAKVSTKIVFIYYVLLQVQEMENKLNKLSGGVTLVRPEEREAVERMLLEKISQWRKRKRMFKDIWDTLTENSPKDPKEFKVFLLACHCLSCSYYY